MSTLVCPIDSEAAYRAAIETTLAVARKEIRIFDRDLVQMRLGDKGPVAVLEAFLAGDRDRRLRIVLHDVDPFNRELPRLVELFRRYGHVVEARKTPEHLRHLADRFVLADQAHGAIRFHADHARGKLIGNLPGEIEPWWRRFDDLWQEGEECALGTTIGL